MTIASRALPVWSHDLGTAARRGHWQYPEWPLAVLAAAAWLALFAISATTVDHGSHLAAHTHTVSGPSPSAPTTYLLHVSMLHWALMIAAMMLPTILPAAREVAHGGRWRRRQRGPALFTVGYLAPWLGLGIAAAALSPRMPVPRWLIAVALITAALWELTPWKVRLLRACHRIRPIPPDGWRADTGCLTRGFTHGGQCVGACWALMAAMTVVDHVAATWLMLPCTAVVVAEKFTSRPDRLVRPVAAALAASAVASTLF